jgi:hypothetical protein
MEAVAAASKMVCPGITSTRWPSIESVSILSLPASCKTRLIRRLDNRTLDFEFLDLTDLSHRTLPEHKRQGSWCNNQSHVVNLQKQGVN